MPKVSIITPCYNAEAYIAATIASVRSQTFTDWEHLVIDDGSTDRSAELVSRLALEDPRLRLLRQQNQGKCAACNRVMPEAAGDYVAILDHDDLYKPEKLAKQVAYLDATPQAGMVYCQAEAIDGRGEILPQNDVQRFQQRYRVGRNGRRSAVADDDVHLFRYLVVADCIPMLTHLMRKQAAVDTGPLDASCWPSDDWDFWIRFSRRHEIHKIDEVLASYRWHENNFSRDDDSMARARRTVYKKVQSDPTLTPEERRQLARAVRCDVNEHAHCCLRWGREAAHRRELFSATRYYLRAARLQASRLRPV